MKGAFFSKTSQKLINSTQMKTQQSHRSSSALRSKIHYNPQYISPKQKQNFPSQPQLSQSQFTSSIIVPKFHNPSVSSDILKNKQHRIKGKHGLAGGGKRQQPQKDIIYITNAHALLQAIIWLMYFVGHITDGVSFGDLEMIDYTGNIIALATLIFSVVNEGGIKSFYQLLHIWSIILSAAFFLYPKSSSNSDQIFFQCITILRVLRLLFPLFILHPFSSFFISSFCVFQKSKKLLLCVLLTLVICSIFSSQLLFTSLNNRCMVQQIPLLEKWTIAGNRSCGNRECGNGTFCRNYEMYGVKVDGINDIGNGLWGNGNVWDALVTNFQLVTASNAGAIMRNYFDVFTPIVLVPAFIFAYWSFQKFIFCLLVVFIQKKKQKRQRQILLTRSQQIKQSVSLPKKQLLLKQQVQQRPILKVNQSSPRMNLKKSIQNKKQQFKKEQHKNEQHKKGQYKKQQDKKGQKQVKKPSNKRSNPKNPLTTSIQRPLSKQNQPLSINFKLTFQQDIILNPSLFQRFIALNWQSIIQWIMTIALSFGNVVLASQFGLNPQGIDGDLYNRKIGIGMIIAFIVHMCLLFLLGYELIDPQDAQKYDNKQVTCRMNEKSTTQMILNLQLSIFICCIFDYAIRLWQQKYILQETSFLTPLFHFLLCLRLYYIYIYLISSFPIFLTLQLHLTIYLKTILNNFQYIIKIIVGSGFLATLLHVVMGKKGVYLVSNFNRVIMMGLNDTWQDMVQVDDGFFYRVNFLNSLVMVIVVLLVELIMIKYVMANCIYEATWMQKQILSQQNQPRLSSKLITSQIRKPILKSKSYRQVLESVPQNAQQVALKQKSLLIFSLNNPIRQFCLSLIKNNYYQQTIKPRFLMGYVVINLVAWFNYDFYVVRIIGIVLEIFVIIDIIFEIVGIRFWGQYSFCCFKPGKKQNIIISLLIIVLLASSSWQQVIPLLQTLRIINVLSCFPYLQPILNFMHLLLPCILTHILLLIPILCGITLSILLLSSSPQTPFLTLLLTSFKTSFIILCEKSQFLLATTQHSGSFYQIGLGFVVIGWVVFWIGFWGSAVGIIVGKLIQRKQFNQSKDQRLLAPYDNALFQDKKIWDKILSLKPELNYKKYASATLNRSCQSTVFQVLKRGSCIICMICFIILVSNNSPTTRLTLYSIHLFFFCIQLLIFSYQSFCYSLKQPSFYLHLTLNILAIPGSIIGFINPLQYSSDSYTLNCVLIGFNALTMIRFIKVKTYLNVVNRILQFIHQKLKETLIVGVVGLAVVIGLQFYLYIRINKQIHFIQCFFYAFLGIVGGDFSSNLKVILQQNSMEITASDHFLMFIIHKMSITLMTLLAGFAIYQLSDSIKQQMPQSNTKFCLYNLNKYLHEQQFLQQWQKLDPLGLGYVPYSMLLHKTHLFCRHISIPSDPYRPYPTRCTTFKKLYLPIYQSQHYIAEQHQPRKQYAILFYDFVYAMIRFAFLQMSTNTLSEMGEYWDVNYDWREEPVSIINLPTLERNNLPYINYQNDLKAYQQAITDWRKKTLEKVKLNITQIVQSHPDLQSQPPILRQTKLTSYQIYQAHRLRNRIYQYLKRAQAKKMLKQRQQSPSSEMY